MPGASTAMGLALTRMQRQDSVLHAPCLDWNAARLGSGNRGPGSSARAGGTPANGTERLQPPRSCAVPPSTEAWRPACRLVRHHLLPAVSNGSTNEQKPQQETSASLPLGPVPFMVVSELGSRPLPGATAVSISVAGHRQHTNTMHPAGNTGAGAPSHSAARACRNSRSVSSIGACGSACSEQAQAPRRDSPGEYNSTTESSPSRARFEADVASNCRRVAARPQGIAPGAVVEGASGAIQ